MLICNSTREQRIMTGFKYAALASVFMFTAGSAAWAQNYNPNTATTGNSNPGVQSSLGQSGPGTGISSDTQQKIRQALEQSGFKDVHVLPQSFLIRAQAPDGSRVVMLMSPDMVSGVIAEGNNQAMQGTGSQPYGAQSNWQTGNGLVSQQQAQQQLTRYGYTDLSDLRPMQGWTADATRNGQNVRVLLSDNGLVATFQGR
jgi:hypothetical protein